MVLLSRPLRSMISEYFIVDWMAPEKANRTSRLKGSILLALQDLASESKDKKSKSRFSSLVSLRRASSPTETKYDELNKTLRDLQDRLPVSALPRRALIGGTA